MKVSSNISKMLSIVLKLVVIVSALVGIYLSAFAGRSSFMGGSSVFMYFTIQSNLLIAGVSIYGTCLMMLDKKIPNGWYVFKFVSTVSITLTGVVFCVVLAPTLGAFAWRPQNVLTHVVVPIAAVLDFFVTGVRSEIKKKSIPLVAIPPLMYAIYSGIGYILKWEFSPGKYYPYFFLDWGSPAGAFGFCEGLPLMGCCWWILLLLAFLMLVGFLYLKILDVLKKKIQK